MNDPFSSERITLNAPAMNAAVITPSDSVDLPTPTRAIYVGTGGDLNVVLLGDTAPVLFKNVASGEQPSWRIKRVLATGTTATDLRGLT